MDEGLVRAVRVAFVRWYEQGLIYRGERLVNWCPTDQTGLSDSEVEHEEVDGELVTFRYPLSDGSGHVEVATTRVETMLGDTGVAVHPDDERYRDLIGKTVRHPFDGRDLPIVADEAVDPAFGTGAVKVTPAHDPTDFEIAQRAACRSLNVLDAEARINENAAPRSSTGWAGTTRGRRCERSSRSSGCSSRSSSPYRTLGGALLPVSQRDRAVAVRAAVVRAVDGLKGPAIEAALDGGASRSGRSVGRRPTSAGWRACATGTSRGSSGGATASRRGTARTGTSRWRSRIPTRAPTCGSARSSRTRTSSTRGSRRSCGRSRRSAGRTTRRRTSHLLSERRRS